MIVIPLFVQGVIGAGAYTVATWFFALAFGTMGMIGYFRKLYSV
jgi:hypothetical protein